MFTPLLMILILALPALLQRAFSSDPARTASAAAVGAGLLFLFTASGHFLQTEPMSQMLPPWVPYREALVYLTGVLEIAVGLALLLPRWRRIAGWAAVAMLVGFFPANVYAAFHHVPMGGHAWGPVYLLVRAPLQVFILGWIWYLILAPRGRQERHLNKKAAGSAVSFK